VRVGLLRLARGRLSAVGCPVVRRRQSHTTTAVKGHTCLQTACAKCEEACPKGAIERHPIEVRAVGLEPAVGYVLTVNEDNCTNCGICCDVCPNGVIREHPERGVAFECDLCDGMPQCVGFCQNPHVLAVDVRLSKVEKAPVPA